MSRSAENSDPLGSGDYGMEDHNSVDGSDQYSYHQEHEVDATYREEDSDESQSGGDYYDEEESNQGGDQGITVRADDEMDEDNIAINHEQVENDGSSALYSQGNERLFSVQSLLGNIAQGIQNGGNNNNGHVGSATFGNRQGFGNLAEAFPEIISLINDGVRRSNSGERNDRFTSLVQNVSHAAQDPYMAMESLRELSQHLLMMDQLVVERMLPTEKLLKGIVNIFSDSALNEELELQLISCRCLYNLFEINPDSISTAVDQGIIPKLQGKLQEISYIDLAEQVLETLELISRIHGKDILRSGALTSCLQYLDFFTIHAQRKAVSIVSNSCCKVRTEDFEIIRELFPILKPIFMNGSDPSILDKLLKALYGICEGLRKRPFLESLFSNEIMQRLGHLVSISETSLESKLRCFDIISVLVDSSGRLSKEFIEKCDVISILTSCFNGYSKNSNAVLHETLIYVPKPLLHAIARTIVLIFPSEHDQVLSMDRAKKMRFISTDLKFDKLLINLSSLLIEIYVNTVEFDIRCLVLIALARITTCINLSEVNTVSESIIGLAGSALAQSEFLLNKDNDQIMVSSTLIVGVLSLLDILVTRFSSGVLPQLKREGIFNLVQKLSEMLQKSKEEGKITIPVYGSSNDRAHSPDSEDVSVDDEEEGDDDDDVDDDDDDEEDDDNEYDMQFSSIDIPKEVKPNKIKFEVLRSPCQGYVYWKISELSKELLTAFEADEGAAIEEIRDIENLVDYLSHIEWKENNQESWQAIWIRIKNCIFRERFEISSFELISTGLASTLSKMIGEFCDSSLIPRRAFLDVFGDEGAKRLVILLQVALTRLESFRVVECGLQKSEERVASLGKQVKIKLVHDGDSDNVNVGQNLSTATISIHCIASFKTLNEFLKHRIAQAKFLSSIMPNLSSADASAADDDIEEARDWTFEFSTDQETLKLTDTIFFAIYRLSKSSGKALNTLWNEPHIIKYKMIDKRGFTRTDSLAPIYDHELDNEEITLKPTEDIFALLNFLRIRELPGDIFINSKLSAKLSRQLEEPLVVASGILPHWTLQLTKKYSFLFPFDTRLFFLQCTSFGYGRLIQLWRNKTGNLKDSNSDDSLQKLGRITRHKLRISRNTLFLSGLKILDKYGSSPSVLEIEYQDEVGTGLGPTLEFYACVSREFTRKNLQMWRFDEYSYQNTEHVTIPLFPIPLNPKKDNTKVLELFCYLGTFVARSMLDNRILDFNFSRVFFELTHRRCRSRNNIQSNEGLKDKLSLLFIVDEHLANSLKFVYDRRHKKIELEQLTLYFTVPGYEIDLLENGSNIQVTSENVQDYIELVIQFFLGSGIEKQLDHFIDGFSKVFPYSSLLILNPDELVDLFGSFQEDWSSSTLYATIKADHGYTIDSPSIHELVSIMSSFSMQERRLFLQFLTGSPKLPIGGFKSLKPKLTVVLKHPEDDLTADAYLPSVMTCANYFKLPKYSDRNMMRSRIIQAMNEGMGPFLLS